MYVRIHSVMMFRALKKCLIPVLSVLLALCFSVVSIMEIRAEGEDTEVAGYAPVNPYYGGWSNCTWSAWQLCYQYTGVALPRLGNAGAWYAGAAAMGLPVGQTPAANAIGVWSNHVVFVTEVSADGESVYIKEGGYCGGYNEGWISATSARNGQTFYGYIYITPGLSIPAGTVTYITLENGQQTAVTSPAGVTRIEFPAVQEDVIRVDDAVKEEPVKQEDQVAKEERLKEDKAQRAAATANKTKQGCD